MQIAQPIGRVVAVPVAMPTYRSQSGGGCRGQLPDADHKPIERIGITTLKNRAGSGRAAPSMSCTSRPPVKWPSGPRVSGI
jgi:hypothetical protein